MPLLRPIALLMGGCLFAASSALAQTRPGPLQFTVTAPQGTIVPQGLTTQLVAKRWLLRGANKPVDVTNQVVWTSLDSFATVANGLVTGVQPGTARIVASGGPLRATINVTVTAPELVSIEVGPADLNLALSGIQTYTATGHFNNGTSGPVSVTWSSSNNTVISIDASTGAATAVAAGTATIVATNAASGVSGKTGVNVALTSIAVNPTNPSAPLGTPEPFAATGSFNGAADADVTNAVLWSVPANNGVAAILPSGLANTIGQGTTTVSASSGSVHGSTNLTVTAPVLSSISVTPASAGILVSSTQEFMATGIFTNGSTVDLTASAVWSSSDTDVASISVTGLASGLKPGKVTIMATTNSLSGSASLTVGKASRFAYVVHAADSTISGYVVDEFTGRLRPNGYTKMPGQGLSASTDPAGKFLYVGGANDNKIYAFKIQSDGTLTSVKNSPFLATGNSPSGLAIDPTGKYLYAADRSTTNPGVISAFMINIDGSLTPLPAPSIATDRSPDDAVIEPSGKFLYVANFGFSTVTEYSIGTGGALAKLGSVQSGGANPQSLTVDPTGKFLFAANANSANVGVFSIGTDGKLTAVAGSPFGVGQRPVSVKVDPSGSFVFVANQIDSTISAFTLNAGTGELTAIAGSPFPDPGAPTALAIDSAGFYLMATNGTSDEATTFSIDSASGALSLLHSERTRSAPASLVLTPGAPAKFVPAFAEVAASDAQNGRLYSFAMDPTNGALSFADSVQPATGGGFAVVAADLHGQLVYAANDIPIEAPPFSAAGGIYGFRLVPGFGLLSFENNLMTGINPVALVVDPSKRFIYSANVGVFGDASSSTISAYSIDPLTGGIAEISGSPFAAPAEVEAIAMDPGGRFLYAGNFSNSSSDGVYAYSIDSLTGSLTALGAPVATPLVSAIAIRPDDRFAAVVNGNTIDSVRMFSISSTGALSGGTTAIHVGLNLSAATFTPDGRYLYVASIGDPLTGEGRNQIFAFAMDESTGSLTQLSSSPFLTGDGPASLAVDPSGKFLLTANRDANSITVFSLDPSTGLLSGRSDFVFSTATTPVSLAVTGTIQ